LVQNITEQQTVGRWSRSIADMVMQCWAGERNGGVFVLCPRGGGGGWARGGGGGVHTMTHGGVVIC
jgi:hypothetical protein